jgi:hypothetical protein
LRQSLVISTLAQRVKKLVVFYGIEIFHVMFPGARQWFLSKARRIPFTSSHTIPLISTYFNIQLPSMSTRLQMVFYFHVFRQICCMFSHMRYMTRPSYFIWFLQ